MAPELLTLKTVPSLEQISEAQWDALLSPHDTPFVKHRFLLGLELTGCLNGDTGWKSLHITLWEGDKLIGAAPCYLKSNSEGEFVYDFSWAQVAYQMGIPYYPKLLVGVPFTPATGGRLLVHPLAPEGTRQMLIEGIKRVYEATGVSSLHINFVWEEDARALEQAGFVLWYGVQYQWKNPGFSSWEDFLSRFNAKRRKQLKREKREVESYAQTRTHRGAEISPQVLEVMHRVYVGTADKYFPYTRQYLTRGFFEWMQTQLPEHLEIVMAEDHGRPLAAALCIRGAERLYGRYWGCLEDRPFLHFHVCYYHSIEECIRTGIKVFEPGAGGEHKRPRGFEPTMTFSAHLIRDARLNRLIRTQLSRHNAWIVQQLEKGETPED